MIYVSRRLLITCLLLVSACVVAGIWGLRSGAVTLETSQVFAALMGDAPRSMTMVVTEWRLPRVLMALLIGAALGVSGAIFQSLMRNPLGSPDVMGFNTGAWSGVLVAMVLFGFLYAAIPLGAAIGALTSGKLAHSARPGLLMLLSTLGSFLAIGLFGLMPMWILGVVCLALFGWLSAVSSLLQYTMLQTQTPEAMLGRINGLWTAQNVTGDAIGAALLGGLGAMMTPVASASASGFGLLIIGVLLLLVLVELRHFRQTPPQVTASDS